MTSKTQPRQKKAAVKKKAMTKKAHNQSKADALAAAQAVVDGLDKEAEKVAEPKEAAELSELPAELVEMLAYDPGTVTLTSALFASDSGKHWNTALKVHKSLKGRLLKAQNGRGSAKSRALKAYEKAVEKAKKAYEKKLEAAGVESDLVLETQQQTFLAVAKEVQEMGAALQRGEPVLTLPENIEKHRRKRATKAQMQEAAAKIEE